VSKFLKVVNHDFELDGKPYFLHLATCFGRRPGTCGADWLGDNFDYNMKFLPDDIKRWRDLGMSGAFVFIPGGLCFDENLKPIQGRIDQVRRYFDAMADGGMKALVLDHKYILQDAWCKLKGVTPGDMPWTPALNEEAERAKTEASAMFRAYFADRPEIVGWMTRSNRFLDGRYPEGKMAKAWVKWLKYRFNGDFSRARSEMGLGADESGWERVRIPTYTAEGMVESDPRSFELSLMQQQLVTDSTNRIIRSLRPVTPNHLMFTDVEGCDFSTGTLTWYIPEQLEADALLHEYYHWEGTRSFQMTGGKMPEPVPNKPSVEIIGAIGYVQMLTRRLRCAGMPVVMTHGVDIGGKKRGVYAEEDQKLIIDHYNRAFAASGGNGVSYWCWTDDELSKTYTREILGMEFDADESAAGKVYKQSGETMGIIRYDGSYRPICEKVRELSKARAGKYADDPANEVCVLMPSPVFYSNYRYRANQTTFGIFNSLARAGLNADSRFSSSGEKLLDPKLLDKYKLIVLGASTYRRDHPETAIALLNYVNAGGNLFFAPERADSILDIHLNPAASEALAALTGAREASRGICPRLKRINVTGDYTYSGEWGLTHDEEASFFEAKLPGNAKVLATADDKPLLYRHGVGAGSVFVFAWNLDAFMFKGDVIDHYDTGMDWVWELAAKELGLRQNLDNEIAIVLRGIMTMEKKDWASMTF